MVLTKRKPKDCVHHWVLGDLIGQAEKAGPGSHRVFKRQAECKKCSVKRVLFEREYWAPFNDAVVREGSD